MTPERWQRIEELFETAVDLDERDRRAVLEDTCARDPELRREVESLLEAHQGVGSFLDGSALTALDPQDLPSPGAWTGRRIGAYRVVRELGRGGTGQVLLGERADREYSGRVAIKVLAAPVPSSRGLERFARERQILADLEHPSIARLLDSGTVPEGFPYLVMEYVEGIPIDEYCDRRRLGIEERLRLFRRVCEAVDYAHRNLVVHRDLKPANILVTAGGTPKLLDFGIAKLLEPGEEAEAPATRTWHRALTPRYASPEQVQGGSVTTATDVYSLGVVLYELVTGRSPYRLEDRSLPRVLQAVIEREPGKPSQAVLAPPGPADPRGVAAHRSASPRQLRRQLEGDLDTILLQALQKDPARRYSSAERLAEDLRRHLDRLPLLARSEGLLSRGGKFVRRNPVVSALAASLLVLVLGFAAVATVQASRLARERDKAREALTFLVDIFESADPFADRPEAGRPPPSAREILDRGAERVSRELEDPLVRATLLGAIGEAHRNLGSPERADPLLRRSLELRRRHLGDDDPAVAESLFRLAELHLDRGEHEEGEALFREALAARLSVHGGKHAATAMAWEGLGRALRLQQRYGESEEAFARALAAARATLEPADPRVAAILSALSFLHTEQGRFGEAESLEAEALALRRQTLGADHPAVASSLQNLAILLQNQGRLDEALEHQRKALDILGRLVDADHPVRLQAANNLARLLHEMGRFQEALGIFEEVYRRRRERLEAGHPRLVVSRNNLATLLGDLDRWHRAEALHRENLEEVRSRYGERHLHTAGSLTQLGVALRELGRGEEAAALQRRALEVFRELFGDAHHLTSRPLLELGLLRLAWGDLSEAEGLLRRALEVRRRALPAGHSWIPEAEAALGRCLAAGGRFEAAEELLLAALAAYPDDASRAGRRRLGVLQDLAALYRSWGRPGEAAEVEARLERARARLDQASLAEPRVSSR